MFLLISLQCNRRYKTAHSLHWCGKWQIPLVKYAGSFYFINLQISSQSQAYLFKSCKITGLVSELSHYCLYLLYSFSVAVNLILLRRISIKILLWSTLLEEAEILQVCCSWWRALGPWLCVKSSSYSLSSQGWWVVTSVLNLSLKLQFN